MALDTLNFVKMTRNRSFAEKEDERNRRQINALQLAGTEMDLEDAQQARERKNVLQDLAKGGLRGPELARKYGVATGDVEGERELMDAARKRWEEGLQALGTFAKTATAETYPRMKAEIERMGIAAPGELPDQYDPDVMRHLAGRAEEEWSALGPVPGAPEGTLGQQGPDRKWNVVVEPETPSSPTLKEVYSPDSPTGSIYVPAEQAVGRPGKPSGGRDITPAQQSNNAEIDAARRVIKSMTKSEIMRRTSEYTKTGRENPDYDPYLSQVVKTALQRKVGDDPGFEVIQQRFYDAGGPASPTEMSDEAILRALGVGR